MFEINITNENQQKNNLDSLSYKVKNLKYVRSLKEEENKLLLESKKGNKEESNNNFFDSNINNLEIYNCGIYSHLIDENKSHHPSESLPLEEVFLKQKEKIKLYKERNSRKLNINNKSIDLNNNDSNNNINSNKYNIYNNLGDGIKSQKKITNNIIKVLSLKNYQFFEKTNFETKSKYSNPDETIPILNNVEWGKLNNPIENIEFKKLAIRTINETNYETNMVHINASFSLQGKSEFWIFTRSFVNKGINESINLDLSSINNDPDAIFNKYSSLIKIIKDKNSTRSFITFGTFCESSRNPNHFSYKIFLKRQIINFNENDNLDNLKNDICEYKVILTDWGGDTIDAKIMMNEDNKYNSIMGNFYLPTNKRSKILFCGEGESVIVNKLIINNLDKNDEQIQQFETIYTLEQKSCSCCSIY